MFLNKEDSFLNKSQYNSTRRNENESLLIIFEIIRIFSSVCCVLGILGNLALIYIIYKTSFRHVSYGLLIGTISFFDCIRLFSSIFYYFLFSNLISLNLLTKFIYIATDRYPVFVVNWCKVLMSIERLLTVRYWEHHTHLDWRSKHKRKQHRQFTFSIFLILIIGLLSQYPNYLNKRYKSFEINYNYLLLIIKTNENYSLNFIRINEKYFRIISYLILDTSLPILSILIINLFLLKEIRRLPLSLQVKVKESIGILFFLTILSIAILPRAFLSFEYFNHAITGYTCFLQSALLRSELKNMIWTRYIAPQIH
ncbi:hypothetical protein I4U23_031289 [Adineta vaga]|nr:hypothetical protein I4U23_031289 [Adineta vaga]